MSKENEFKNWLAAEIQREFQFVLGTAVGEALMSKMEEWVKREDIADRPERFLAAMRSMMGSVEPIMTARIVRHLSAYLGIKAKKTLSFKDFVAQARVRFRRLATQKTGRSLTKLPVSPVGQMSRQVN